MFSNLYTGNVFILSIMSNPLIILALIMIVFGLVYMYKSTCYTIVDFVPVVGSVLLLLSALVAKDSYYDIQFDKLYNSGYQVLVQYSGFSDKTIPDLSACTNKDTIRYLDYSFNDVQGVAEAFIVICK